MEVHVLGNLKLSTRTKLEPGPDILVTLKVENEQSSNANTCSIADTIDHAYSLASVGEVYIYTGGPRHVKWNEYIAVK